MCGIVGLFLKDPRLEPELGALTAAMLEVMTDRGPDSAGFAIYGAGRRDQLKLTARGADLEGVAEDLGPEISGVVRDTHLVLTIPAVEEARVRRWLAAERPDL